MSTFDAGSIEAKARIDRTEFNDDLRKLKADAREFASKSYSVKIFADTAKARAEIDVLQAKLRRLQDGRTVIRIDTRQSQNDVDKLGNKVDQLGKKTKKAGEDSKHGLNLMLDGITQLLPPAVVLASGLAGLSTAAVGFGIAGIAAFKGATAEVKKGTVVGQQYASGLAGIKVTLAEIERTGAANAVDGFSQATKKLNHDLPQLNELTATSATNLGKVASALTGSLVGGLNAASPLIVRAENDFVGFAQKAEQWANSEKASRFFDRLSTDLDHALPFLANFGTLFVHVVTAIDDVGRPMIDVLTAITGALDKIPTGVLEALATGWIALRTAMLVTAPITAASKALLGLGAAEAVAGAGAGAGAAGAGAGAGAGAAGGFRGLLGAGLARLVPVVATAVIADVGLNMLDSKTKPLITDPTVGPTARHAATALDQTRNLATDLFTGHWSFHNALAGPSRQEEAGLKAKADRDSTMALLNNILSGQISGAAGGFVPINNTRTTTTGIGQVGGTWASVGAQLRANNAAQAKASNAYVTANVNPQTVGLDLATKTGSYAAGIQGLTDYQTQIQKTIDAEKTWTTVKDKNTVSFKGNTYEMSAWKAALKATNGDANAAIGLLQGHTRTLAADTALQAKAQAEQDRVNTAVTSAATKYHLTADQVARYAQLVGVSVDEVAKGKVSQDQFNTAVDVGKQVMDRAGPSVRDLAAAIDAYGNSEKTAADKGALIRQTLISSQGDYLSYATTVSQAASANQQLVNDFDKVAKGVINAKTGMIDMRNAGAAPLLADLSQLQQAAGNSAQAVYDYQVSIGNAKGASKAAADVFKSETTDALVKEHKQLGITRTEAQKLSDLYYHWDPKVTTDIEAINADKTQDLLIGILTDLDKFTGNHNADLYFELHANERDLAVLNQIAAAQGGGNTGKQTRFSADGNIFSFANGTEKHVAQIAPGGAWRVWAEPETGGEAYIPLASSKRPRSRQIAAETVKRLGGHAEFFDNGGGSIPIGFTGVTQGPSSSGSGGSGSGASLKALLASIIGTSLYKLSVASLAKLSDSSLSTLMQAIESEGQTAIKLRIAPTSLLTSIQNDNKALQGEISKRDSIASQLQVANQKLSQDNTTKAQYADSIRSTIIGAFDIGTSGNGYAYGIQASLSKTLADAQKAKTARDKLYAMHFDPKLLQQLTEEGPAGYANLEALAGQSQSYLNNIGTQYEQLFSLGTGVGYGQADIRYNAGIAADTAKVASLNTQNLAVTKQIAATLAALQVIAKTLADDARKHGG